MLDISHMHISFITGANLEMQCFINICIFLAWGHIYPNMMPYYTRKSRKYTSQCTNSKIKYTEILLPRLLVNYTQKLCVDIRPLYKYMVRGGLNELTVTAVIVNKLSF